MPLVQPQFSADIYQNREEVIGEELRRIFASRILGGSSTSQRSCKSSSRASSTPSVCTSRSTLSVSSLAGETASPHVEAVLRPITLTKEAPVREAMMVMIKQPSPATVLQAPILTQKVPQKRPPVFLDPSLPPFASHTVSRHATRLPKASPALDLLALPAKGSSEEQARITAELKQRAAEPDRVWTRSEENAELRRELRRLSALMDRPVEGPPETVVVGSGAENRWLRQHTTAALLKAWMSSGSSVHSEGSTRLPTPSQAGSTEASEKGSRW